MNAKLLDIIERVGWTFIQAAAATVVSAGAASTLQTFDWRAALLGAGTAAVISLLKQLGLNASLALLTPVAPVAAPSATPRPTIEDTHLMPAVEHEDEDGLAGIDAQSAAAISAAAARRRAPYRGV